MTDFRKTTGRCLCGAVRFKFDPATVKWSGHCYCESCRRATGSPVTTFVGVEEFGFRWTGAAPHFHESSPGVKRGFCPTCGTPMSYQSARHPGEVHFHAATLIDPTDVSPEAVCHADERLPWAELKGGLPQR